MGSREGKNPLIAFGSVGEVLRGNLLVMIVSSGIWTFGSSLVSPFDTLYYLGLGGIVYRYRVPNCSMEFCKNILFSYWRLSC
ncbi:MAG: hypothetical protein NDF57_04665 [archaeon GBS-70-058]|nr:hypothetical protein [Candidatus Culexarchaeum nevadense]